MKNDIALKNTYNKIASLWNADHERDNWWIAGTNAFLSFLPKLGVVLDVGCAGGNKTKYIKEKGFIVKGIDFSEEMIKNARTRFGDIDFEVLDIYDLDNLNEKFDGISCQAVLLHIPKKDIENILQKLKNRLKSDGVLFIAVKEVRKNGVEEEKKKENDYGFEYERFFSYFNEAELFRYLTNMGLIVVYKNIVDCGLNKTRWINIIAQNQE